MAAPTRTNLQDHFLLLRARDHPGETLRMVVAGVVAGRSARRMQRFLGIFGLCLVVAFGVGMASGPDRTTSSMLVTLVVLALTVPLWIVANDVRTPRPTGSIGIMVTDVRAVVAEQLTRGEPRVVAEVAADAVTLARLERVDDFWVQGGVIRIELGGEPGPLVVMEVGGAQARSAQLIMEEAGLVLLPSATVPALRATDGSLDLTPAAPAVADPMWVPRSLGIVLGFLFGSFALLGVAGSMSTGDVVAGVVSVMLAVLLLGGAIALLRSRPRSSPRREGARPTG